MASIKAKIYRFNPGKDSDPYFDDYEVKTDRSLTIHELLTMIHRDQDGTLAYRQFNRLCSIYPGFLSPLSS